MVKKPELKIEGNITGCTNGMSKCYGTTTDIHFSRIHTKPLVNGQSLGSESLVQFEQIYVL